MQDKAVCPIYIRLNHVNNPDHVYQDIAMCTDEHIKKLHSQVNEFTANMPAIASRITEIWRKCNLQSDHDP